VSPEHSDPILADLARIARDEAAARAEDPRWERLARGELSAADEAEIRRQAAGDPEIAALYEAFRPLSDETKGRIADRVLAAEASRHGHGTARVVPFRPLRRAAIVAIPLALAAAVALWVARPPTDTGAVASADAPLPEYALGVTGGDRATRSGDAPHGNGAIELRRESRLELVLRPSKPITGAVAARGFLVQGADARAWNPAMEVSGDGAIRAAGPAGAFLGVPAGAWDVVLVVGRAGGLPSDPQLVVKAMADRAGQPPWQTFVTHVRLVDGP
jgi:hypothetical protein